MLEESVDLVVELGGRDVTETHHRQAGHVERGGLAALEHAGIGRAPAGFERPAHEAAHVHLAAHRAEGGHSEALPAGGYLFRVRFQPVADGAALAGALAFVDGIARGDHLRAQG